MTTKAYYSVLAAALLLLLLMAGRSDAFTSRPTTRSVSPKTISIPRAVVVARTSTTTTTTTALSLARSNQNEIQGSDRLLSCLPYLLPLMDGNRYGRYIFALVPPLGLANAILLGPFELVYRSIPFGQFIAFLGVSFLSRNPEIPRAVRFNLQQALILDILLIFPSLFGSLSLPMPSVLVESGTNFVFYALVGSVGYALFSNLTGKLPNQIPVVSEATEMQIGPF